MITVPFPASILARGHLRRGHGIPTCALCTYDKCWAIIVSTNGEQQGGRRSRPATLSRKMAAVRSFLESHNVAGSESVPELADALRPPPAPRRQPRLLSTDEVAGLLAAPPQNASPPRLTHGA